MELTTVNPGLIVGPTFVNTDFASGKIAKMFLNDEFIGGVPVIKMALVDVRDVAQAHVNCIGSDEAQGQRFLLVNEALWCREIGAIYDNAFGNQGYTIPTNEACYCLVRTAACFRADARKVCQYWGAELNVDNTRSK